MSEPLVAKISELVSALRDIAPVLPEVLARLPVCLVVALTPWLVARDIQQPICVRRWIDSLLVIKMLICSGLIALQTPALWFAPSTAPLCDWLTSSLDTFAISEAFSLLVMVYFQHMRSPKPSVLLSFMLPASAGADFATATIFQAAPFASKHETYYLSAMLKIALLVFHEVSKNSYFNANYSTVVSSNDAGGFWSQTLGLSQTPVIKYGRTHELSINDISDIPTALLSANMYAKFQSAWQKRRPRNNALLKTCMAISRRQVIEAIVAGLFASLLHATTPLFIEDIVSLSQSSEIGSAMAEQKQILMWITFSVFLGQAVLRGYSKRRCLSVQTATQGALAAAVFRKLSSISDKNLVQAAKVTLVTTHLPTAVEGIDNFFSLATYLIEASVHIVMLWAALGPTALTIAVLVIGCLSIGIRLGSSLAESSRQLTAATSARSQTSSDLLANLENTKLLGLEAQFQLSLMTLQKTELIKSCEMAKSSSKQNIIVISYTAVACLFSCSSHLTPQQPGSYFKNLPLFFRSFVIINELCFVMAKITHYWWKIPTSTESYTKIEKFLKLPAKKVTEQAQQSETQQQPQLQLGETQGVQMQDVSIAPGPGGRPLLSNVNISVPTGATAIITGSPGTGKSVLLNAIAGRMSITHGRISVSGRHLGYCGQNNWLQSRSVKENIIGPTPFNERRYSLAKSVCLLTEEISLLSGADDCIIGPHGTVLNHALQQRIALARAVYSEAPVLVLDDPLSAQSKDVGDRLISGLFGPQGVLQASTAIIATSKPFRFSLVATTAYCIETPGSIRHMDQNQLLGFGVKASKPITSDMDNIPQEKAPSKLPSLATVARQMSQNIRVEKPISLNNSKAPLSLYLSNVDRGLIICCIGMCILGSVLESSPQIMLRIWFGSTTTRQFSVVGSAVIGLLTGGVFVSYISLFRQVVKPRCSKAIFINLVNSTLRTPITSLSPARLETLQSLFTEGMRVVTFNLPDATYYVLAFLSAALVAWVTAISCIPQLIYVLPIFLACVVASKSFFHHSYRQAQRLHTAYKDKLQVHFVETIAGAAHIDCLNWHVGYSTWSGEYVDASQSTFYFKEDLIRWHQGIWHIIIAVLAFIFAAASIYATSSPYQAGITMAVFLDLCKMIKVYLPSCVDLDIGLSVLDQIREFIATSPQEAKQADCELPVDWPAEGVIEFNDASITHGPEEAQPTVQGFTLTAPPTTKMVIQEAPSRTKSPFILSMLNRAQYRGSIKLDGVEIREVSPRTILSRVNIIVDRPIIFPGTVRQNLLPQELLHAGDMRLYTRTMKCVLEKLSIWDVIDSQGGLLRRLEQIQMSPEQMQRFAFAQGVMRYLLNRTSFVLIDGITNYVDNDSNLLMSRIISQIFQRRSVMMAAHSAATLQRPYLNVEVTDGEAVVRVRPTLQRH
ncbi:hypothetical protein VHEMI01553 [[Torrubiella] hemipterigena]|uniref:ABC transporter domain-containing protein n=1 Tax=[Torrubiella] hemipterigena TaxID=1531966 RepID=A0A0A1T5P5_9HYPO|nr:hypothetical protein VHEMI01553 [[Torrubiella] hemipterigena]